MSDLDLDKTYKCWLITFTNLAMGYKYPCTILSPYNPLDFTKKGFYAGNSTAIIYALSYDLTGQQIKEFYGAIDFKTVYNLDLGD